MDQHSLRTKLTEPSCKEVRVRNSDSFEFSVLSDNDDEAMMIRALTDCSIKVVSKLISVRSQNTASPSAVCHVIWSASLCVELKYF